MGPATPGAPRRLPGPELENASRGGSGVGRDGSPLEGQPRGSLLRPERSVSAAARPRACRGWRVGSGCDSEPLSQPPFPWVQRPPNVGGVPRRDQAGWADPGSPGTPGLAEMGSDSAAPRMAECSGPLAALRLESCSPGFLGFSAGGGRWSSRHPSPPGERVCVSVSVCVSARCRPAGPGSPRLASRRAPLATGSLASLARRVDVVGRVPPEFTAVVWAQVVYTSGLVDASCSLCCLASEVCAHPLGHFQLLLVNSFSSQ